MREEALPPQAATDGRMLAALRSTFGYSSFRPLQAEIVQAILAGRDVLVLMPTGGGKSLCYQLPALLLEGTTVVVSPLIALMKDQVDALRALGVAATYINSSLDPAEVKRRQTALARGEVKLLYVAPERLMMPDFLRLLSTVRLSLCAIDEAHCISEWGHDFRPEYRDLRRIRSLFPGVPLGAFTATATARVQADIRTQLSLDEAGTFCGSYNRPNLFYEVRPKKRAHEQLIAYLRDHPNASGIVYCLSRAGADDLAHRLRDDGFQAQAYHAGLAGEERRRRQEAFIRDDVRIMVATVAFGMGIDKPDVRFVVHFDMPKSLEAYYQESGRAGRDGEPGDCILFFSSGDVVKYGWLVDEKASDEERRVAAWQLRRMADWAETQSYRRRELLAYFDEPFAGQADPCCDNCRTPAEEEDYTVPAQMLLSCVKRTGERFGSAHVIGVLRGSKSERILHFGHDRLSTYGIGRDRSEDEWRHLARELVRGGYVRQTPEEFNALKVTERGRAVLFEGERVLAAKPRKAVTPPAGGADQPHPELFERLRALRKRLADERGLPPYVIFHDSTLKHMAAALPATPEQLRRTPGVGERKASDYGELFLACVADFVRETGAEAKQVPRTDPVPRRSRDGLSPTVLETLRLFREGSGVAEIAQKRGLVRTTVEGHLAEAIEAGEPAEVDRLVGPEKRRAIEAVMAELGGEYLGPVLDRPGSGYTYGELRFVRAITRRPSDAGCSDPPLAPPE